MRRSQRIAGLYALFAVLATGINLGSQWLVLRIVAPVHVPMSQELFLALGFGTAAGLVTKYVLDKRYIFGDLSMGVANHAAKFSLYTTTGIVTTAIFWSSELFGAFVDPDGIGLYIGGAAGLVVGYIIKYRLDKAFVFEVSSPEDRLA